MHGHFHVLLTMLNSKYTCITYFICNYKQVPLVAAVLAMDKEVALFGLIMFSVVELRGDY